MNKINIKQNKNEFIDKLAAHNFLYSEAKKIFMLRLFFSIILAVVSPILMIQFDSLKVYVASVVIFYTVLDIFFLKGLEGDHKYKAAKIQELFDIGLFDLSWNSIVAGDRPDEEQIFIYSKRYKDKNRIKDLKNWYPREIEKLDLVSGSIVCQRANIWWDESLRKKFFWFLVVFISILTLAVLIFFSNDLENFFIFTVALLPLYETLLDYANAQFAFVTRVKKLKLRLDGLLEKIIKNEVDDLRDHVRTVQDEIFRHRKSEVFIPDWCYKIFRDEQEKQMNYSAKYYTDKILKRNKAR